MADETHATGSCPLCGKPREERYRPFCSRRCADVDLARWLGGRYAIPAASGAEEDGDEFSAPPDSREDSFAATPKRRNLN